MKEEVEQAEDKGEKSPLFGGAVKRHLRQTSCRVFPFETWQVFVTKLFDRIILSNDMQ
jgi:hypothetical protein